MNLPIEKSPEVSGETRRQNIYYLALIFDRAYREIWLFAVLEC